MQNTVCDSQLADRAHRNFPRWWLPTLIVLLSVYAVLTTLVIVGSPLDRLDLFLYHQRFAPKTSPWHQPVVTWVWIGQGVPCSTLAALYAIRRSVVTRSWRPWVLFTLALFGLNASVGAMKHATGRIGPLYTDQVHTIWAGGTIFPSGHAANATVMYGLIAMLVPLARRRLMIKVAAVIAISVGLGTVLINTHWISDVFGGWIAGLLVLQLVWLVEPWATRLVTRAAERSLPILRRWWIAGVDFTESMLAPMPLERAESPDFVTPAVTTASEAPSEVSTRALAGSAAEPVTDPPRNPQRPQRTVTIPAVTLGSRGTRQASVHAHR